MEDIPLEREFSHIFYSESNSSGLKMGNAKTWVATTFRDYKTVLQYEDSANGRIIIVVTPKSVAFPKSRTE